ncbi:hypothetical protein AKJ16_DCAP18848 [Drosera capensis]
MSGPALALPSSALDEGLDQGQAMIREEKALLGLSHKNPGPGQPDPIYSDGLKSSGPAWPKPVCLTSIDIASLLLVAWEHLS